MSHHHQPTPEQSAILEATRHQPTSLMIRSYAGCGKTSTLEMAAKEIKSPSLALAFNKSISLEMSRRFPSNFTVKTLNGLGHSAWIRANPSVTRWNLDPQKLGKLITQTAKQRKMDLSSDQWDSCRRLITAAMQAGISPNNQGAYLCGDTPEGWSEICPSDISEDDFEYLCDLSRHILDQSIHMARAGTISFDDQIYCPSILGGKWPQFPVVFVDEAQDLSPLNHLQLQHVLRPDSRLFACGDPMQAIYAFRGADSSSMDKISTLRPSWTHLPLATTFRCPKAIVSRQQSHAPGFTAWAGCLEGAVIRAPQGTEAEFGVQEWNWEFIQRSLPAPSSSVAVLCRNNAPLLGLAFRLVRQGISISMLGRDIGKGLIQLSRKICPDDSTPVDRVAGLIRDWSEREESLARANNKPEKIDSITDRSECLQACLSHAEVKDAGQLRAVLERLFAPSTARITLSSIHRAKGLEWDCVVHLDPWRIPSKQAKAQGGSALQQEFNLKYVAETRTRHTLILANFADFVGSHSDD